MKSVRPPSTVRSWAVMNPASSEARKAAAAAMSSGVPTRRIMALAAMASKSAPLCAAMSVAIKPGAIAFTVMPCGAKLEREAAGEGDDGRLGGGVEGGADRAGADAGDGRDIDDAAPAACLHIAGHRAGDANEAVYVDVAHALHLGEIEIVELALAEDTGVVDQDIDGAESLARGVHEPGAIGGAGQVGCDGDGTAAGACDRSTTSSA